MLLNLKEEKEMIPFMDYVTKNADSIFVFSMRDGSILKVKMFNREFESDNGLNLDDPNYEEYWEMPFEVVEIIKDEANKYLVGDKFCINYHCIPTSYTKID